MKKNFPSLIHFLFCLIPFVGFLIVLICSIKNIYYNTKDKKIIFVYGVLLIILQVILFTVAAMVMPYILTIEKLSIILVVSGILIYFIFFILSVFAIWMANAIIKKGNEFYLK